MPFLLLFLSSWLAFFLFSDRSRLRQLLPLSMLAMIMSFTTDEIIRYYPLWSYHDPVNFVPHLLIVLMDDFGIYPVTTYLFLQHYPTAPRFKPQFLYLLAWTSGVILLETLFVTKGWMVHHQGWSLSRSYVCDWLIFLFLRRVQRLTEHALASNTPLHSLPLPQSDALIELLRATGVTLHSVYQNDSVELVVIEVEPGGTILDHHHDVEEVTLLLEGELILEFDGVQQIVGPSAMVSFASQQVHRAWNASDQRTICLSIFRPAGFQKKLEATSFDPPELPLSL